METFDFLMDDIKFSAANVENAAVINAVKNLKRNVYFENSVGKICGKYIVFKNSGKLIHIKEIAFLQIKSEVDKTYNVMATILGIIALIGTYLLKNGELLSLLLFAITILFFSVSIFYKKKQYFIQVVFCKISKKVIRIHKKQQIEADEFIKKLSIYRQQNLHLKH